MRIGYGFDSHEFRPGVALKIGGVTLAHSMGLAGHSDGDVLLHALTDALLGAVAAGDIGGYFPPTDPRWKDADSAIFVREALAQVKRAGLTVSNVDSTLILDQPKIGPYAARIRHRMAELLGISPAVVSVKAKTPEGLGTANTAIAHVMVLLENSKASDRPALQVAEAMPQPVVDTVVEEVLQNSGVAPKKARAPRPVKK